MSGSRQALQYEVARLHAAINEKNRRDYWIADLNDHVINCKLANAGAGKYPPPAFIVALEGHLMAAAVRPTMRPPLSVLGFARLRKVPTSNLMRIREDVLKRI